MLYIAEKLAKILKDTEFYDKTYIVGGAVRDLLRGVESHDIDLVVELQDGGIKLAKYLYKGEYCSRPVIYSRFSTAFVFMEGYKLEFVMTRSESYLPGSRKPDVQVASLREDVFRRDFTVNSLLYGLADQKVLDLTGKGIRDLEKGVIRATSDPSVLYQEDPLRMLRAVRFAVQLNFIIENKTFEAIIRQAESIKNISVERIRDELQNILLSDTPERGVKLLLESGLLELIIPELLPAVGQKQNKYHIDDVFEHTMKVLSKVPPELPLRLAALFHDIAKPLCISRDEKGLHFYQHEKIGSELASQILNRLKFPVKTRKLVNSLIRDHLKLKNAGKEAEKLSSKNLRKLILNWGDDLRLLLKLIHADNLSHAPEYVLERQIPALRKRVEQLKKGLTKAEMPVKGKDVIEFFNLKPGKKIKKYLDESQEIWLDHPDWDREKILKYLKFKEEENGRGK